MLCVCVCVRCLQDKFVHVYLVKPVYKNDRIGDVLYLCDCETMHQSVETLRGYVCATDSEEGEWTHNPVCGTGHRV